MQRFAAYLSLARDADGRLPGADGFRRADERRGGCHFADLFADALRHLHACSAGLAAGSTYSLLGISREMMTMIALEPLFAIAIVVGARACRVVSAGRRC